MRSYIVRRLILIIPTVFLVSLIVFFMIRSIPGNIVDIMVSQMEFSSNVDRQAIIHSLGFDVPMITQYGHWMGNILLHGDLGKSLWENTPVINEIATRWPVTFELGFLSILISQIIALPIGIYSAIRQDTVGDYIARSVGILCIAVPGFWLATLIIVFPAIWWNYMPPMELTHFFTNPLGNLQMFILPALVLGMGMSGITMRMTRTMMLEVLRQDYIRTAWAKGLKERVVVIRHGLKNALIPVVTIIGGQIATVLAGTVIIENIFSLPGIGQLIINATLQRDYTMVSGVLLLFAIVMVVVNLAVDVAYGFIDPRVHYK